MFWFLTKEKILSKHSKFAITFLSVFFPAEDRIEVCVLCPIPHFVHQPLFVTHQDISLLL